MTETRNLQVEFLGSVSAFLDQRAEWDDCVSANGGDIYFTADWVTAWWCHFGGGCTFVACRITERGKLCGVLPLYIEAFRLGPFTVRLARLMGVSRDYPVLALPLKPEHVIDPIFAKLTTEMACDGISLTPLSGLAPGIDSIRNAADSNGLTTIADSADRQHTVLSLPSSFDAFLNSLSKSRRKEYRKDAARLAERGKLENTVSTKENALERLEAFIELHGSQWRAVGKAGHFEDVAGSAAFYRDVVGRLAASGRAILQEHRADNEPLSVQLAFCQGRRIYWRLVARTVDPEFSGLGVGRVGLVERIRLAIADGIEMIEAGAGEYDYKLSYGGTLVPISRLIFAASGTMPLLRLRGLLAWSDFVDLLYYRLWFLKIAPRLRRLCVGKPKPLCRAWIRTRI